MRWDGERVPVTGGASFIGSYLVGDLVAEGANVRVADDFSSGERKNPEVVRDDINILEGNLKHWNFADEVTESIDMVFHLAADHGGRGYISQYIQQTALPYAPRQHSL